MKKPSEQHAALSGITVLDLTRVLAGPFCTMLLGDLGAEIIKIEVPGVGDDSRSFPPFIGEESAYFMNLNRNKKSITLNLKSDQGKEVFFDLVAKADVVIENFRPGTMDRIGVGYDAVKAKNPDIIFSSISGFGQYGPYKDYPGYDIIGQAMGGIMSVTGWPDSPPTRTGTAIADVFAGLFTTIGILSSLIARPRIGSGQRIDVALVDSVVSAMETIIQIGIVEERNPERTGNRYEFIYPYDSFRAKDGWVVLGVGNNKLWRLFCTSIEKPEYLEIEKYQTNRGRIRYHQEVKELVEKWTVTRPVKEIVDFMLSRKIPSAPIFNVQDIIHDEHIAKAREMILDVNHPVAGDMKVVGSPIKMSKTPTAVVTPAPNLGEHSESVLCSVLGYSPEKIGKLRAENAIGENGRKENG